MKSFLLPLLACVACSSSAEPNTVVDSGSSEAAVDTSSDVDLSKECAIPAEANALAGQISTGSFGGEPAFTPRSVYRIERAKDPAHPQIMFLSAAVECAALKEADYLGAIPSSAFIFLELGAAAAGEYTAAEPSPPSAKGAYIAHSYSYTPPNPPSPLQYTESGSVTVTAYDATTATGTFYADFGTEGGKSLRVCGRFAAKPCAVSW